MEKFGRQDFNQAGQNRLWAPWNMGGRGLTARWVAAEFEREQEGAGVEPPGEKRRQAAAVKTAEEAGHDTDGNRGVVGGGGA